MIMIISKKIRLKPTKEQEVQLWKSVGTARWVYNWALERQQENYKNGGKFIYDNDLRKEITQLKKQEDYKWLGDVSNDIAKQAVKDACNSYKRFFKGQSKFPRFKSRRNNKKSFYNDVAKLKVNNMSIQLAKIGWIKTSEQLPMNVKYMNPRVSYDNKYWYLSVSYEQEFTQPELTDEVIGIDLGIKALAVCSNGVEFKNINKTAKVRKIEKRLRRLQRSVSRKYDMNKEGNRYVKTCNIIKIEKQIQLLHRRLSNIRNNHLHQTTNTIVRAKPSKVVMEDLNVKSMMKNCNLAKAISQQKFYEFKRQMEYKCDKYGIKFIQVDRFFPSSKLCSNCGQINKDLKISDRVYHCDCGLHIDRDLNASINLANYGKSVK